MNKKKIISLVAVLAMICSLFSNFTLVNAEGEKTIKLAGSLSTDGKEITVVATAQNAEGGMKGFTVNFMAPEGVKSVSATTKAAGQVLAPTIVNGEIRLNWLGQTGAVDFPGGELATIKISLENPLAKDFVATLTDDAGFNDTKEFVCVADGMVAEPVKIEKWVDPDAPPATVERPGKVDIPDTPDMPTPVVPDPAEKGITLKASMNADNTVMTVVATAINGEGGMKGFTVNFMAPEGVETVSATTKAAGQVLAPTIVNGEIRLNWLGQTGAVDFPGGELATITVNLNKALTAPFAVTLTDDAGFNDTKEFVCVADGMTATSAVVTPSEEEKKTEKPDQALKNYVGKGYEDAIAAAKTAGNDVYLTVDVKKGDDKAVYGADYAFEYPAGNVIKTEAEFLNLVHGYTDADMADVINNGTFKIYNKAVNKIATTLNATNTESQLVDPVDKTIGGKTPSTPKPSELSLKAAVSPTTINPNTSAKITATVTSGDDVKVEEGDIVQFLINKDDKYVEFTDDDLPTVKVDNKEYVSLEKDVKTVDEKGVAEVTARVAALEKTGSTTVLVRYFKNGANTAEDKPVKSQNVNFKVTAVKGGNGGSGSSSDDKSNSKNIAGSNSYAGNNTGKVAFTDINTVVWAQDAINSLVARGVLNGRNNLEFDPNGTVTRAEFAKMVVLAFGLTGGKDNEFTDVDTSAWYAPYVARGVANSVITGYDDGTFRPNGLISRQEMSAMVMRAVNAASKSVPATVAAASFSDNYQIGDWAKEAVSTLQQGGVINGYEDGTFKPYGNATRAEAAVVIYRAFTNAK